MDDTITPAMTGWHYVHRYGYENDVVDDQNRFVCSINGEVLHGKEGEIGNLIAAAPRMRSILADLVEWEATMGGWEFPAFAEARLLLDELRDIEAIPAK